MTVANERDPLAEATALAEQLRVMIANLDEHIEQRAQRIVAERTPTSVDQLISDIVIRVEQAGEAWRQEMIERLPEGRQFTESLPAPLWTSSVARLVADVCDYRYKLATGNSGGDERVAAVRAGTRRVGTD